MPIIVSLIVWFVLTALVYALAQRRLETKGGWLGRIYGALVALGSLAWLFAVFTIMPGTTIGGFMPLLLIQPVALLIVHAGAALKPVGNWLLLAVSMMTANLIGTACLMAFFGIAPSVGHVAGFLLGLLLVLPVWLKAFRKTG